MLYFWINHSQEFPNSKYIFINTNVKKVHSYLYSFVPFGMLLIVNVLLIRAMRQKIRDLAGSSFISKKKQLSITLSVMLMTLLFIVFTLPISIANIIVDTLLTTHNGKLVLYCFGCFSFTYHAFNLVILCRFNKHFYKLCKEALTHLKSNKEVGTLEHK